MKLKLLVLLFAITSLLGCGTTLPEVDLKLESAYVRTNGDQLIVGTGRIERVWSICREGLSTHSISNLDSGKEWRSNSKICDWEVAGLTNNDAQLISITATKSNDDNFTSDHIDVVAEFLYPNSATTVKYHIWVYPDAPGVRTQLYVKGNASLANLSNQSAAGVTFKTTKGSIKSSYEANGVTEKHFASTLEGKPQVEIQVLGIDLEKSYKLGMTLWSFEDRDVKQNITVTSVDSENKQIVAEGVVVPSYKKSKEMAKEIIVDLPTDILLDGSCRVIIAGDNGNSTISELYVYEQSNQTYTINGDVERVESLIAGAPQGYVLSGYFDCGEKSGGVQLPYNGYVEHLPIDATSLDRNYVGYFNDTQHRNTDSTPLIRQTQNTNQIDSEKINWASIIAVDDRNGNGVAIVKESHKCVNQYGVDTGDFEVTADGVFNSGLGFNVADIDTEEYKWCWASWCILYSGDEANRQLAIKEFDRTRYPIDPSRDIYIQANTWGSDRSREAAKEDNILLELDIQKELGVDIQQIDDGWQNNNKDWLLRSDWYPEGWSRVRAKSEKLGVRLGLWGAAMPIELEDLKRTYDEGGFVSYKLDFASLGNHKNMTDLMTKVRNFIEYTDHKVRVNWDLTENAPRFGYYWAKEYGCVYLENRKPTMPINVVYVPYLVLRDCWHLAKYTNINKFQTSIQNVDMVLKSASDAHLHTQSYATAIGLSGVPLLFMETHFLSDSSREEMKNIFANYKKHREEIFDSYAFSIGSTPDNKSWSGFQYVNNNFGHLLLFRELNNTSSRESIKLEFLKDVKLKLTNTMDETTTYVDVDSQGCAEFTIEKCGDFRLYRYEIM
ncbi:MAG: hypothetical protein SNF68_03190 [Rikenellaceae bacterium]